VIVFPQTAGKLPATLTPLLPFAPGGGGRERKREKKKEKANG